MTDLQKNDVPAVGQVRQSVFIHENSGLRILFAGNSITKHSPRPAMGWLNDCGMAASDEAHDYVHLLLDRIRRYDPNPAWAIAQVGSYEANLWNGAKPSDAHADAAAFGDGIGTRADTHGRFNHPSDLGMQLIADAFWAKMEPQVAKIAEKRAK